MTDILAGPHAIALGVDRLSNDQLVAFPTETVYGLGANALSSDAVNRVFALKGRPATNPLIVHVVDIDMAKSVVAHWPDEAQQIAKAFWPGPVTLVLPKADSIPANVCANGSTVAVRCPNHPCALALIESFAKPIVGPSANPSGRISPTTPEHVADGFPNTDLLIVDGGHCRAGIESTVVDLSTDRVRILRPGIIGAHAISECISQEVDCNTLNSDAPSAKSPGLIGAHYQPIIPTKLVETNSLHTATQSTALIAWSINTHPAAGTLIPMPASLADYASSIYNALHLADKHAHDSIWIEHPPTATNPDDQAIRAAILERLTRAAHA